MNFWRKAYDTIKANVFFMTRDVTEKSYVHGAIFDEEVGLDNRIYEGLYDRVLMEEWDKMRRTDSQLKALTRNVSLPIRKASYVIESDDDDIRMFCERQIGLAQEDNNISWDAFLRDFLTFKDFGFYIGEYQTGMINGRKELIGIYLRPAKTIEDFILDDEHRVIGVTQQTNKDLVEIRENIIHATFEAEGNKPQGDGLLEACYEDYKLKQALLGYTKQAARRYATGIPHISYAVDNDGYPIATQADLTQAEQVLKNYAEGNTSSFMLPSSLVLSILGMESRSTFETLEYLKWLDLSMSRAYLSQLIDLGDTSSGSRAVGDSFSVVFFNSLKAIADQICEEVTDQLLNPLVEFNYGTGKKVKLVAGDIVPEDTNALMEMILKFAQSGVLDLDSEQKQTIVEMLDLPAGKEQLDDREKREEQRAFDREMKGGMGNGQVKESQNKGN